MIPEPDTSLDCRSANNNLQPIIESAQRLEGRALHRCFRLSHTGRYGTASIFHRNNLPSIFCLSPHFHHPPANHSLTLLAVGSGDTEQPVVGWRRWLWRTKNRFLRPPKSDGVFSE